MFGQNKVISEKEQQVIVDNGMSFALAPMKSFIHLMKYLKDEHGVLCQENKPLWSCQVTEEQYLKLPSLRFNFKEGKSDKTKYHEMPFFAYMKLDGKKKNMGWLLLSPSDDIGIMGGEGEEIWVLGA